MTLRKQSAKSNAASALELHEPFQTENHVPECGKLSDTFCGNIFHHGNARDGSRMPDTLDYYKKNTDSMMFAKYQYVLKSYVDADGNVLETDNSDAEKFDMTSLLRRTDEFDEEVSVYGVETDSAYVKLKDMDSLKDNEVYISDSFADKYGIKPGDTIKLDAQYEKKTYKFKVKGTYDKSQSIAVFMPIEHFADTFDFEDGRISGFCQTQK